MNIIRIIIPIIIPTLGIIDSDMKEKSSDIKNAKIVTIKGQLFFFFFFVIKILSNYNKKALSKALIHKMAIFIVNFMS